ncbi:unnamed protein product [Acanthosepion pharaonis]|uniref:Uncharacterized protein n=1 Tax=Acanthosepion pharaonis TaxID=158019 RepID=A0A812CVL8_ACAPH|nr:unnamed protein product [Sepia pharaonis]
MSFLLAFFSILSFFTWQVQRSSRSMYSSVEPQHSSSLIHVPSMIHSSLQAQLSSVEPALWQAFRSSYVRIILFFYGSLNGPQLPVFITFFLYGTLNGSNLYFSSSLSSLELSMIILSSSSIELSVAQFLIVHTFFFLFFLTLYIYNPKIKDSTVTTEAAYRYLYKSYLPSVLIDIETPMEGFLMEIYKVYFPLSVSIFPPSNASPSPLSPSLSLSLKESCFLSISKSPTISLIFSFPEDILYTLISFPSYILLSLSVCLSHLLSSLSLHLNKRTENLYNIRFR